MGKLLGALVAICVVAACSDDPKPDCSKGGGVGCFTLPTAALVAYDYNNTMVAPALGCGPIVPVTSTHAVTVNGSVINYAMSTQGVASAMISVYTTDDFANPVATTTSASNGAYSISIPTGMPDLLFAKVTAAGYVDLTASNLRPDLTQPIITKFNLVDVTPDYLDQLAGLVRTTQDMTKATLAVGALDCNRHPLQHAIAVISTTSGKRSFIDHAQVFYTAEGMYPVPELQSIQADTNNNGSFAAINIPVTFPTYLQVWGFPDDAAAAMHEKGLALVAEYPLHLFAGELGGFNAFANQ